MNTKIKEAIKILEEDADIGIFPNKVGNAWLVIRQTIKNQEDKIKELKNIIKKYKMIEE